jgi:phosphomannomutase
MFGAGRGYLSSVLKKFSIKHSSINNAVNPAFPGLNPEPIDSNLHKLKSSLKKKGIKNKFAVGFATDGDADRIGAVDCEGNFIDSHKIFSIILDYLIKEGRSGSVVKTVSVSKSIDDICKEHNIELHEVPIGFKNIAALMTKDGNDVFMGGEESGGIGIASHLPERDGIFNALLLLKIIIKTGKNLNEILNGIFNEPYPYSYVREDLHLDDNRKRRLIEKLKSGSFGIPFKNNLVSSNFIDGFKFGYKDGSWLLIRPSGTEPVLRIYAESKAKKKTEGLINKVKMEIGGL